MAKKVNIRNVNSMKDEELSQELCVQVYACLPPSSLFPLFKHYPTPGLSSPDNCKPGYSYIIKSSC